MKLKKPIFKRLSRGLFALLLAGSPEIVAQSGTGSISGRVSSENTGRALQGAIVRVLGASAVDRTDLEGRFTLSGVPVGSQQLTVSYVGLDAKTTTVNVTAGQTRTVNVNLASQVYELEAFTTTARMLGQDVAINRQKTAAGIVNIISEEQFGSMLDGNIGQALQRLPGISVNEDQDGSQGSINIRGIEGEYNSIQIDGNRIPSSGGRNFNPRQMGGDGVTTIEVIKAPTPDRDGDAIGGIVNLVTRSAFQREGRVMKLKLGGMLNSVPDNWGSSVSFSFSDIFSVGDGENNLGISFSVSRYDTDRFSYNADMDWVQVDPGGDNAYLNLPTDKPVWFFESTHFEYDTRETENLAFSASIDYRTDENNSFYFRPSYSYFERKGESFETDIDIDRRFRNSGSSRKTYAFLNETSGGGTAADHPEGGSRGSFGWIGTIDNDENDLYIISTGGRHERADTLFTYDLFISKNKRVDTDSTEVNVRTDRGADPNFIVNYEIIDINRGDVTLDITNGLDPKDLSRMDDGEIRDTFGHTSEDVFQARIDWEKTFTGDQGVFTLKTGAKLRESDMFRDRTRNRYDMEVDDYPFASILKDTGDEMLFSKRRYWEVDIQAAKDLLQSNPELYEFQEDRFWLDSNESDYDATEETLAGYVMGTYEKGPHTFIAGVRREDISWSNINKKASFVDEVGSVELVNQGNSYAFWLPGVHGRHELKENLILRESYNRSYGRPRLSELSKGRIEEIEFEDDGSIDDWAIEQGNPDLVPAISDNFDIQLEYYTEKGGLYSIGFFYKDIENFTYDNVYDFNDIGADGIPIPDDDGDFEFEQPVNGTTATNKGIEIIARQRLHFLPGAWQGLAFGGSLTLSDSKANIPSRTDRDDLVLPGFSDVIYTATLDYDWGRISSRIDYRFRGDYIEGLGSDIESDEFFAGEYRLDAELVYRLRSGVYLYAAGTNLTDEGQLSYQGFSPFIEDASYSGTKYSFGLELTF